MLVSFLKSELSCISEQILTYEAVHVVRVARVVRNGEVSVANCYLALTKWQSKITEFVQQTAHGLKEDEEFFSVLQERRPGYLRCHVRPCWILVATTENKPLLLT